MLINLEDFEGNRTAILVNEFRIANEESGYRIFYKNFSSPLGKSLPARGTKFRYIYTIPTKIVGVVMDQLITDDYIFFGFGNNLPKKWVERIFSKLFFPFSGHTCWQFSKFHSTFVLLRAHFEKIVKIGIKWKNEH